MQNESPSRETTRETLETLDIQEDMDMEVTTVKWGWCLPWVLVSFRSHRWTHDWLGKKSLKGTEHQEKNSSFPLFSKTSEKSLKGKMKSQESMHILKKTFSALTCNAQRQAEKRGKNNLWLELFESTDGERSWHGNHFKSKWTKRTQAAQDTQKRGHKKSSLSQWLIRFFRFERKALSLRIKCGNNEWREAVKMQDETSQVWGKVSLEKRRRKRRRRQNRGDGKIVSETRDYI